MVGAQQSLTLNCEAERNPDLLPMLGLHVTRNKFATRTLWTFHNSLMMSTIPAEWSMYMEMIKKLPMFVSHNLYIVVMQPTAVSLYKYQHDILIGFLELNQRLACQVIKAQIVPLLCLDG